MANRKPTFEERVWKDIENYMSSMDGEYSSLEDQLALKLIDKPQPERRRRHEKDRRH